MEAYIKNICPQVATLVGILIAEAIYGPKTYFFNYADLFDYKLELD